MQCAGRVVLHVDVDAFFCQVEQLHNPAIRGKACAVQQHQDIIAVNYPARAAGVKKHMAPSEARRLLAPVGGHVVHVFCEEGFRVSYRPYREASDSFFRLLRGLPGIQVVEKASIDEAFLLCQPPASEGDDLIQRGLELGQRVREEAVQKLGLTVSVGVASNKLLAKLLSRVCKPDGLRGLRGQDEVAELLRSTPVDRLPGMGGQVAAALERVGVQCAAELAGWEVGALAAAAGIKAEVAEKLVAWGGGWDPTPVVDKGPPKSLQVKMTLTPTAIPIPPAFLANGRAPPLSVAGGTPGMLDPLRVGAPDSKARLARLLRAMATDLLGRVMQQRHEGARWPQKLGLGLVTTGPGAKSISKTSPFPPPTPGNTNPPPLTHPPAGTGPSTSSHPPSAPSTTHPTPQQPPALGSFQDSWQAASTPSGVSDANGSGGPAPAAPAAAGRPPLEADGRAPGGGEKGYHVPSALLEATSAVVNTLSQILLTAMPPGLPVTQVQLSCSSFAPLPSLSAPTTSITSYFLQQQQQQQQPPLQQAAASTTTTGHLPVRSTLQPVPPATRPMPSPPHASRQGLLQHPRATLQQQDTAVAAAAAAATATAVAAATTVTHPTGLPSVPAPATVVVGAKRAWEDAPAGDILQNAVFSGQLPQLPHHSLHLAQPGNGPVDLTYPAPAAAAAAATDTPGLLAAPPSPMQPTHAAPASPQLPHHVQAALEDPHDGPPLPLTALLVALASGAASCEQVEAWLDHRLALTGDCRLLEFTSGTSGTE